MYIVLYVFQARPYTCTSTLNSNGNLANSYIPIFLRNILYSVRARFMKIFIETQFESKINICTPRGCIYLHSSLQLVRVAEFLFFVDSAEN